MLAAGDEELARRAREGDHAAFGEVVRRHQQAVFNVAYRLLGNRRDAEDATQEAFLRAFRAFHTFDPARPLAPWLKRIAANVCLNWLETARVKPLLVASDVARPDETTLDLEELAHSQPSPEQALAARETAGRVRAAILKLPPHYRVVIELRHFQDLSYDEMTQALGRPLSSVKSDLFRARKLLAEWLGQEE
ncbi:MAG: sigma-70 family RNA polymerase sigma factor [Chloroflexi bacterium]|nr:sigma-70 family RNA polymerase sigma factor [Chloroflexota bacterium]MCI0574600.1 sigma-70 family RNA polymerase sigma factor [Chloroflexota bacterium]MCI0644048.1 sigma-70 family RNA polymerase sigma factor [Chloroflexota bacterium]MCI0731722.1 sigma-70 family RNA polymerase sigma factor [Chloroflexota bacterium]